jgi:hypothetical protein
MEVSLPGPEPPAYRPGNGGHAGEDLEVGAGGVSQRGAKPGFAVTQTNTGTMRWEPLALPNQQKLLDFAFGRCVTAGSQAGGGGYYGSRPRCRTITAARRAGG